MDFLKNTSLFSRGHTIAEALLNKVEYAFELLPLLKDEITELGKRLPAELFEQAGENIWIARSAKVAGSADITGPCIIDEGAEIRHCAFIRGSALIGKGCVVGNSTELKNTLLFDGVQVPHYNYVGDSVLGYRSHMGAGAITSNVKSDKTSVKIRSAEETVETGMKKLGAILGDLVEIGCGSVLCPGTVIGSGSTVYPLSMVRGYVPAGSIYKKAGEVINKR